MTPAPRLREAFLVLAVVVAVSSAGCGPPSTPDARPPVGEEEASEATTVRPPFVGRAWVSDEPGVAPGTMRVFMADGTLLMDSCTELYRLARWTSSGAHSISWEEDTARIEAAVIEATDDSLRLRLSLRGGETVDEVYRPAQVPFVCPDLARTQAQIATGLDGALASCR